jgi:prolyl 4-hydroxylase
VLAPCGLMIAGAPATTAACSSFRAGLIAASTRRSPRHLTERFGYHIAAMGFSDLRHFIRVYDQHLDATICRRMIESFAELEQFQRPNGRGIRAGFDESAWTELNVTKLSDPTFLRNFRAVIDQALERYNQDVGLTIRLPNSFVIADLVMKRYRSGHEERFQLHFDAIHQVANRYLVFLWYLNDVASGGETRFPQLQYTVPARVGRLLMFPPYWMYQHEGIPPQSGEKFILSTYLLFTASTAGGASEAG